MTKTTKQILEIIFPLKYILWGIGWFLGGICTIIEAFCKYVKVDIFGGCWHDWKEISSNEGGQHLQCRKCEHYKHISSGVG